LALSALLLTLKGKKRGEFIMYYETDLFDHSSYGEAFIGMAKHVADMTMLERQIFEDCTISAGRVVAPHLNTKGNCAQHLRPEIIQQLSTVFSK
jgi:hypothetical protein